MQTPHDNMSEGLQISEFAEKTTDRPAIRAITLKNRTNALSCLKSMDAVFALGKATVNQVVEAILGTLTAMAVRRMMHLLEENGHRNPVNFGAVVDATISLNRRYFVRRSVLVW